MKKFGLIGLLICLAVAVTLFSSSLDASAIKLKSSGKIFAEASNSVPTKHQSDFDVAWRIDLEFANSTDTAALCVWRRGKDPRTSGLHLKADAARLLSSQLADEAPKPGISVDVDNHSGGEPQVWQTFTDQDAEILSGRISAATLGH